MSIFSWLNQPYGSTEATHHRFEEPFWYEKGTVVESIKPGGEGVIKLQGVYWIARSNAALQRTIPTGTLVAISARKGLTLIVEPLLDASITQSRSLIPASSSPLPLHAINRRGVACYVPYFHANTAA